MEKKNQIPKYPHLRFPEFTDEWKEVKLGEVAEILMCKRILASQTNTISGVPFFKIGTIGKTPDCYITRELFDEYKLRYSYPKKGQVLLTCSGTIGRCWIFSGEDAYFQDSNIVWIDNPEYVLLNRYLYYILINTDWSKLNSSTITRLYNDDLRRLKLRLPSLPEQRKIAALFSLIDERIEVQNAIIKEQEAQKAALLRRLFDRTLRFPEFTDEWKEVKLGEVAEIIGGGTPSTTTTDYWNGGIVWFNPSEIGKKKYVSNSNRTISHQGLSNSGARLLPKGTVLLTTRATIGEIAIANVECTTNQGFQSVITGCEANNEYVYYFLSTQKEYLLRHSSGSTFRETPPSVIRNLPLRLPSLPEQRKIADLLSAVDERLSVEREYAEQLKQQKAYLLRQMFI